MQAIRKFPSNLISLFSQKLNFQSIRWSSSSMPSEYISTNLANGVGRYVCQLQRITFKFCKEHTGSRGIRYFLLLLFFLNLC